MRPARLRSAPIVVGILAFAAVCVGVTVPPWVLPPIESIETGPAAIEMVQFKDPDRVLPYSAKPKPLDPADNEGSPKATEVYQNVQVLTDLTDAEFTRLMLAMTEWVSPKQGCEYCHDLTSEQGFADDSLYTKKVARRMLEMVRYINSKWPEHVAPSGVTCYTCHRGQNVPPWTWYRQERPSGDQFLGKPRPWHIEAKTIRQFFPDVPYNEFLLEEHKSAQIQSTDPLVSRFGKAEVAKEQDAEDLYLFMMQMAQSMGVNCTYCHNSRAFRDWSQSTPYRWIAYWGIRMSRDLNSNYIEPLASVFPASRKGPQGDPAKIACGTCHEGNNKPLGGYRLLDHYLVGLTEDGKAPDPAPKQAILLGQAIPVAVTGPDQDAAQPAPTPAAVSEEAIGESVAPAGSSEGGQTGGGADTGAVTTPEAGGQAGQGGADYKSQTQPGQPVGDETLGGTVTPVPQDQNTAPGSTEPTGTDAPMNSTPDQMAPGSPMLPSGQEGTNNAPGTGQPPSNPLPADETPGKKSPEEQETSPTPPPSQTPGQSGETAPAESANGVAAPNKGPAQGTTTRFD
ncbi:photosynthetic reaction center cytochrome PufC [Aurantimonas sp. VKM B-3413]|uniref:photosynthetic reaction center cytochrome PufC n=1 Tax=Aurantimonas sp. VKM B-3413 TaxID=2779401 RepID=UPI001E5242DA|nr:photosynthetic reaction center cytochrome PufC [Aurantimonas sp. VKM B-3413]MCB8839094.1 photosynthetic reaction center cytochrome c subunit [Aurantimonas sp. VKM B-3413]